VDKKGISLLEPVPYIFGMCLLELFFFLPYLLATQARRQSLKFALADKKRYILVVGIGAVGTYLIVLFALTRAPASYVSALRECSVLFGYLLGVVLLKEPLSFLGLAGSLTIVTGLVLIKLA
jgi:drug/metabolite transporter (DMT)-like permease